MNKVILMGRLTRDPEIRTSVATNTTTARFTLAVDRRFKKEGEQQTADFINCIAFGKTAEFIERYLHQGTKIAVVGRIQTGSYTNKDGQKVYTTDVVIEECEFAESKNSTGSSPAPSPRPQAAVPNDGFMSLPLGVEDEGLPFN
jgi:single-strand DNA-binding protein